MIRIVCLSDTHHTDYRLEQLEVPRGDVLIHAGDATFQGKIGETSRFIAWMDKQPHRLKYLCPGNHDYIWEHNPTWANYSTVNVLINQFGTFQHEAKVYSIFAMSFVKELPLWAFNSDEREIGRFLQSVADSKPIIDILLTHMPPYGILDYYGEVHTNKDGTVLGRGEHLGSRALRVFVNQVKPKVHIFGHIHNAYGTQRVGDTLFVNAAILNDNYNVAHTPIVLELDAENCTVIRR